MKISPLLIPHMLNITPHEMVTFINGITAKPAGVFTENCRTAIIKGKLEPQSLGSLRFADGNLNLHAHKYTPKMQKNLIGSALDIYGEIPLAHRTQITGFEDNCATFECTDDYVSVKDAPQHTKKSILARRRRMAAEAFFHIKLHWMTRRLLNGMDLKKLAKIDLHNFLIYDSGFLLDEKLLSTESGITAASIGANGSAPDMMIGSNVKVDSCAVSIPGRYPDTVASSLKGGPARKVIDHPMFEGSTVNTVRLNASSTRITFSAPERTKSYAEDEPERVADIMARLKRSEDRATPANIKDWDKHIQTLESDRKCEPEDSVRYMHFYRSGDGKKRQGQIRKVK